MPKKPFEIYREALRNGAVDAGGKGSHRKLKMPDGKIVILPLHRKELAKGTYEKVMRDLGLEK